MRTWIEFNDKYLSFKDLDYDTIKKIFGATKNK
mgnify:CR=1